MAIWSRLTATIAGIGVGRAGAIAIEPVLEPQRQDAWKRSRSRILSVGALARMIAQGLTDVPAALDQAERDGYDENRLRALTQLELAAPGTGELIRALNRRTISPAQFEHGLAKHQTEPQYWDAITDLANDKLDPVQIANAIHRGLIPDPGLLAVPPPTGAGKVPAYPTYDVPPLVEARAAGIDRERLGVLVGLTGLPMGPHEAANAVFRHIITQTDFERAIAEGNTRNEWGDAIFEESRQIPTARDFLENALRGYRTLGEAIQGAALHGMTREHATMIYQNQGRPMNIRQITQALARGGVFKPEPGEIKDPYDASIVEGNIKPAYYDLAKALRYTLPSVFAIRQLATSGVWGEAKVREMLLGWGWKPEDAADVAQAWATGGGTSGDPHVGKAQQQLWTALHKAYVEGGADEAQARDNLTALGVPLDAQDEVLAFWNRERGLTRKQLTVTNLKTAYRDGLLTRDEILDDLLARGYSLDSADLLVAEWEAA